ncbi:MAG TPA: methyltransferase domain-containing protein [Fimbriimonadaceae bacterium]|nr:methyltransferase domain-containing protein [Fimbriimonadaceae bacterium]
MAGIGQSTSSWRRFGVSLLPPRATRTERIDSPNVPTDALRRTYRDIRLINRLFGGTSVVLQQMKRLLDHRVSEVTVLDVGTGSADIPRSLLRWARSNGKNLRILACDLNPAVLDLAREPGARDERLEFAVANAFDLPFADGSFDFVLSSLTFHHFDDESAARALAEMERVARRALIVNDLRRAYLPAVLIWLVTRALRMHPFTRHDAPLSVLRSRTLAEYRELVGRSCAGAQVRAHRFWRAVIVLRKAS